jgi:hypothetical protein
MFHNTTDDCNIGDLLNSVSNQSQKNKRTLDFTAIMGISNGKTGVTLKFRYCQSNELKSSYINYPG